MKIAILDFEGKTVFIRDVPSDMEQEDIEDIMCYFENELKIHADDCQYMMGDLTIDNKAL